MTTFAGLHINGTTYAAVSKRPMQSPDRQCRRKSEYPPPNYTYSPSIFWRPFLVVTLVNIDRLLVVTVHKVYLYVPFTWPFLI